MIRNNLKSYRHKYEMNSKEFADYLGINPDQYSRYENNRRQPTLEVALRISERLDEDLRKIFVIASE